MKNVAAVIDFGTSKIVTLIAESGSFDRCDIIGSGTVPYEGYKGGRWHDSPQTLEKAIANSIAAAELESKFRVKELYVGVPCEYIRVRAALVEIDVSAADQRVSDADVNAVQDAAADQLDLLHEDGVVIHRSPAWFMVDDGKKSMSPVGVRGSKLSALVSFVLADFEFVERARGWFSSLGVSVLGFLSPLVGEALLLLPWAERDKGAVLIDVGYLNTEFSVVCGDAVVYHDVLPMGGGDITASLSTELDIFMQPAEQIKRSYIFLPDQYDAVADPEVVDKNGRRVSFPSDLVRRVVEEVTDELCDWIALKIRDAERHLGAGSQVFITGGGLAMMRSGREYLANKLGRPVKGSAAKATKMYSERYASAMGLVDLVFSSIEQRTPQDDSLPGRVAGAVRGLFKR